MMDSLLLSTHVASLYWVQDISREDYMEVVRDVNDSFVGCISKTDSFWRSHINPITNMSIRLRRKGQQACTRVLKVVICHAALAEAND